MADTRVLSARTRASTHNLPCPSAQDATSQPGTGGGGSAPRASQSHRDQHPVRLGLNERSCPPACPTARQVCKLFRASPSAVRFPGARTILALEWRGHAPHGVLQKNNTGTTGEICKSKSQRGPPG